MIEAILFKWALIALFATACAFVMGWIAANVGGVRALAPRVHVVIGFVGAWHMLVYFSLLLPAYADMAFVVFAVVVAGLAARWLWQFARLVRA